MSVLDFLRQKTQPYFNRLNQQTLPIQPVTASQQFFSPTPQLRSRDIIRELPNAVLQTGIDLAQYTPRTALAIGQTLTNQTKPYIPKSRIETNIFGREPVTSFQTSKVAELGRQIGLKPLPAKTLGVVAGSVGAGLNFLPTGEGQVYNAIAKSADTKAITGLLRTLKIDEEVIPQLANKLTKVNDIKKVQALLKPLVNRKPSLQLNESIGNLIDQKAMELEGRINYRNFVADIVGEDTIKNVRNFVNSKAFQNGKKDIASLKGFDEVTQTLRDNLGSPEMTDNDALDLLLKLPTKGELRAETPPKLVIGQPKPKKEPFIPLYKGDVPPPPEARGGITIEPIDFSTFKDKSTFALARDTMERNIDKVAGKQAPQLKSFLTEPIKINETERSKWLTIMRQTIKTDIVNQLKIRANSLEDKLIQRYGEGRITLDELKQQTQKWQSVQQAAKYFRLIYDNLLNEINATRQKFGYALIPKREDYFRHFQELGNVIDRVGLILHKEDLPTNIAGITDIFSPGKPFTSVGLQRRGGQFTESAINGIDNYLDNVSRQIFHTDSVQRARLLEKYIRDQSVYKSIDLPNLVANLHEYGNLIAGKKSSFDRAFESVFGRSIYGVFDAIRRRISGNAVVGNISSALTNFIPFTQAIATTNKTALIRGIYDTLTSPFLKEPAQIFEQESQFIARRYHEQYIDPRGLKKASQFASWLFQSIDMFTAHTIVSGKYLEGIKKGLTPDIAIKQADNYAARLLADRSVGQLPNIFNVRILAPLTQFQTEVNNVISFIMRDIPQIADNNAAKIASAIGQFFIYSYLFNNAFELVSGYRPTLDPLQAASTVLGFSKKSKDQPLKKRLASAIHDLQENLPFIGGFIGGRIPLVSTIPNPSAISNPNERKAELRKLYYLIPPFGGGQLRKTIEGVNAYTKGYSQTPTGKVRFSIAKKPVNQLRTTLFGQYAVPEARNYFLQDQVPFSNKQSQLIKSSTNPQQTIDLLNQKRLKRKKLKELNISSSSNSGSTSLTFKPLKSHKVTSGRGRSLRVSTKTYKAPKLKRITIKSKKPKLMKGVKSGRRNTRISLKRPRAVV